MSGVFDERLREIETTLNREDPLFVDGFRHGEPHAPVEYRRRRRRYWLVAASVVCLVLGLLFGRALPILVGLIALGLCVLIPSAMKRRR